MNREKKLSGLHNDMVDAINKSGMPEQEVLLVLELLKDRTLEAFKRKINGSNVEKTRVRK